MATRQIVTIKGLDEFKKGLSDLELNQYPYAMKEAINRMAEIVQKGEQTEMVKSYDRPTPFTVNALKINYATKNNLSGGVVFKDPTRLSESQHYLYPTVYGVRRGFKKFEGALYARGLIAAGYYAVPGKDVKLDAYGNVAGSLIVQILSWFGANVKTGSDSTVTDKLKQKKKKGTKKTYGFTYFSLRKRNGNMLPGIYKRTYTPFGSSITSVFIFVPKNITWYPKHFAFHETGKFIFNTNFKIIFNQKLYVAMLTAFK
jgi:hypothetical protein